MTKHKQRTKGNQSRGNTHQPECSFTVPKQDFQNRVHQHPWMRQDVEIGSGSFQRTQSGTARNKRPGFRWNENSQTNRQRLCGCGSQVRLVRLVKCMSSPQDPACSFHPPSWCIFTPYKDVDTGGKTIWFLWSYFRGFTEPKQQRGMGELELGHSWNRGVTRGTSATRSISQFQRKYLFELGPAQSRFHLACSPSHFHDPKSRYCLNSRSARVCWMRTEILKCLSMCIKMEVGIWEWIYVQVCLYNKHYGNAPSL